ncbi:efflux pump kojT [Physcia stellaris]|nr:efflux pump kojT [Physcia stellaris]
MGLIIRPNRITLPVPDFDIGVDPVTGWTQFPENLHYRFDRYPPYRHTVCLALNEAGRRALSLGPVILGKHYVGQEWSERDCQIWDSQSHDERLKSCAAAAFLLMDSLVLPIDLQAEYVSSWVREEGDVEDEDDLDVEEDAPRVTYIVALGLKGSDTSSFSGPRHKSPSRTQKPLPLPPTYAHKNLPTKKKKKHRILLSSPPPFVSLLFVHTYIKPSPTLILAANSPPPTANHHCTQSIPQPKTTPPPPGAFLTYSTARFGTHNPPDINLRREQEFSATPNGVPHLSSNAAEAISSAASGGSGIGRG